MAWITKAWVAVSNVLFRCLCNGEECGSPKCFFFPPPFLLKQSSCHYYFKLLAGLEWIRASPLKNGVRKYTHHIALSLVGMWSLYSAPHTMTNTFVPTSKVDLKVCLPQYQQLFKYETVTIFFVCFLLNSFNNAISIGVLLYPQKLLYKVTLQCFHLLKSSFCTDETRTGLSRNSFPPLYFGSSLGNCTQASI